jgi:acetylornithine deacetylase
LKNFFSILKIGESVAKISMKNIEILHKSHCAKAIIETPSFFSEEDQKRLLIENWFTQNNIPFKRENNNVWAFNQHFDANKKPTIEFSPTR